VPNVRAKRLELVSLVDDQKAHVFAFKETLQGLDVVARRIISRQYHWKLLVLVAFLG
jgi:hypothetical protein